MITIKKFALAIAMASAPLSLAAAYAAEGDMLTDAREQAPEGLIGMWKADIEASSFPGDAPKALIRSFAYTEDGAVLVSFAGHYASGRVTSGHWAAQVDGTPGIEYHSSAGSVPYNVVSWEVIGEGNLALKVFRHGELSLEAEYQLSEDGQSLEYTYGETTIIYRRWDLLD